MHFTTSNTTTILVGIGCVCLGLYAGEGRSEGLAARVFFHHSSVLVGEPLVATVVVSNSGPDTVDSSYLRSGTFRSNAQVTFAISNGALTLLRVGGGASHAKVIMAKDQLFPPGRTVRLKKVVPLVLQKEGITNSFLAPGTYRLKTSVEVEVRHGMQTQWVTLETPEAEFTVEPLDERLAGVLDLVSSVPKLELLLIGRWDVTPEMKTVVVRLEGQFPKAPHVKYLDARLARSKMTDSRDSGLSVSRTAVTEHLTKYPDSPLGDELLFGLGNIEEYLELETGEGISRVISTFERIVKDYPDSPLVEEAQAKLARLRTKLAEATVQASETNAVSETSTTNSTISTTNSAPTPTP